MAEYTDIFITGNKEIAKETIAQFFEQNKFNINWASEFEGKAKRGSTAAKIIVGGLAETHEIDFKIFTTPDDTVTARIIMAKSGWSGGLIGNYKVKNQYKKTVQAISDAFASKGIYKGRNPK